MLAGIVGTFIPCVLYGGNMERILPRRSSFGIHCLSYSSLYFLGNCLFNMNSLAPCFSYPSRTALRRKFNLEVCFFSAVINSSFSFHFQGFVVCPVLVTISSECREFLRPTHKSYEYILTLLYCIQIVLGSYCWV